MSKEQCCGNCRNFSCEDIFGNGICLHTDDELHCSTSICQYYEPNIEGWTEITPDNVDELYEIKEDLLIIAFKLGNKIYYQHKYPMRSRLKNLAESGGYYYYVLPELKI